MNTPTNDGGPAFPHLVSKDKYTDVAPVAGMSLRDWFAGQCIGPLGVRLAEIQAEANASVDITDFAAQAAYNLADAMLKAREGKQ